MLVTRLSFPKNYDNFPLGFEKIGEYFVTLLRNDTNKYPDIGRERHEFIQYYVQRIFPFRVENK